MKYVISLIFLLMNVVSVGQQLNESLFTIEKDSIACNKKYVEPFFWVHQNDSYILENMCTISSQDKKYDYTVTLSDYNTARGDGGYFRIIDIKVGNKIILQLHQSDGWDKIPEGIRDLSCQGYFLVEALSDSVTALVFCGYPYNSEPELLTIVILNKETATLVFNKQFIFGKLEKSDGKFCMILQDRVMEYVNDEAVNSTDVYRIWKENGVLRFGGPYETMYDNMSPGDE